MQIGEFQQNIEKTYYDRDSARGMGGTFMWFIEEVGELATAVREGDQGGDEGRIRRRAGLALHRREPRRNQHGRGRPEIRERLPAMS